MSHPACPSSSTLLALVVCALLDTRCHGAHPKDEVLPESASGVADDSLPTADTAAGSAAADEDCWDDLDNDGDGLVDGEDPDCDTARPEDLTLDLDADGYPANSAILDGDCDDGDPTVHPDAPEVCDGHDDDCDGEIDETDKVELDGKLVNYIPGCAWYHLDRDGDGWAAEGGPDAPTCTCTAPDPVEDADEGEVSWVQQLGDCDDSSDLHAPGAVPLCDGYEDDNCDGLDDDEAVSQGACADATTFCADTDAPCADWYTDSDGDGEGDASSARCYCETELSGVVPEDRVESGMDCDDTDESFTYLTLYYDKDCDGYGDSAVLGAPACGTVDVGGTCVEGVPAPTSDTTIFHRASNAEDCDDGDVTVSPAAVESCGTAGDDDCDGVSNQENAPDCDPIYYTDADGDGYGFSSDVRCLCELDLGSSLDDGDCDDGDAEVSPAAEEVLCDQRDNDCDDDTTDGTESDCATDTADSATGDADAP